MGDSFIKSLRLLICSVMAIATLGFIILSPSGHIEAASPVVNLLANQSWSQVPGTQAVLGGVRINPLGRSIVLQNGGGGQDNPPVNVSGSHLTVQGDFVVSATMTGTPSSSSATIRLYGSPPIIYDEWRQETPSIQLMVKKSGVKISIWDGSRQAPAKKANFKIKLKNVASVQLGVYHIGSNIVVTANGAYIGTIADYGIFSSGSVWFGADTPINKPGWTLTGLAAAGVNAGTATLVAAPAVQVPHSDPNALRNLSAASTRNLPIGTAVSLTPLMTNPTYRSVAVGQFNMWTTENDLKPQFVHPQPSVYSFQDGDTLVNTALANGITVHGHTLVFGEANPRWMQDTPLAGRQQVMINHINSVVGHYKGKISEWDVVNEPLSDDDADYVNGRQGLRPHIWYQGMGAGYIDTAFRTARAADPAAKLFLNDYGLEEDGARWNALISLLTGLKQRGVPIDGVGFESHVYEEGDHENPAVVQQHIQQLAAMGLVARISEMDVHGENAQTQASEYQGVLSACIAQPTCTAFSTWGFTDRYGSTTQIRSYPLAIGNDLMFYSIFYPKPAFTSLQTTLRNTP